ncbi:hypothetical protein EV126DRAFT_35042 [Verticillium dahliae]|nr:hypothetical protein EV126DRAFT_35042 [Verticillium dahliae]
MTCVTVYHGATLGLRIRRISIIRRHGLVSKVFFFFITQAACHFRTPRRPSHVSYECQGLRKILFSAEGLVWSGASFIVALTTTETARPARRQRAIGSGGFNAACTVDFVSQEHRQTERKKGMDHVFFFDLHSLCSLLMISRAFSFRFRFRRRIWFSSIFFFYARCNSLCSRRSVGQANKLASAGLSALESALLVYALLAFFPLLMDFMDIFWPWRVGCGSRCTDSDLRKRQKRLRMVRVLVHRPSVIPFCSPSLSQSVQAKNVPCLPCVEDEFFHTHVVARTLELCQPASLWRTR